MYSKSEEIDELALALAKAQGQFQPVLESGKNPHLGSAYATFDDVVRAVRRPLADNGLAYTQMLTSSDGTPALTTMLIHESGQWLASTATIDTLDEHRGVNELQAFGAALTYTKRYALSAMLGVASAVDDDGESYQQSSRAEETRRSDQPSDKLMDRWSTISAEAESLGIDFEPLPDDPTADRIKERGVALRQLIDQKKSNGNWPPSIVEQLVDAGLTENSYSCIATLEKSDLEIGDGYQKIENWFAIYRGERAEGGGSDEAASTANTWMHTNYD